MEEESAYTRAADELETNQVDKATWAKAFSESDGDTQRTKARYITLRVRKLTQQEPGSASIIEDQTQSNNAKHSTPVDSGYTRHITDEKDRLWQEAQAKTLGHSVDTETAKTLGHSVDTETANPREPYAAQESTTANNTTGEAPHKSESDVTALYKAVIGEKNTSYYLTKFAQFDRQGPGLKASWNWAAFFLVPIWALYRKMYGWFFALWGASAVATFIEKLNAPLLLNLAVLAAWAAFGIYANSLYHHHLKKKIAVAQSTVRAPNVLASLGNKGGVNPWVSWVGVGLIILGVLLAIFLPATQSTTTASVPSQQITSGPNVTDAPTSAPATRTQYASTDVPRWVFLNGDGHINVYADPSSIKTSGNMVEMWSLFDNTSGIATEFMGKQYMSVMQLAVFDCKTARYQIQGNRFYSKNMGQGSLVDQTFDNLYWYKISNVNASTSSLKYACER